MWGVHGGNVKFVRLHKVKNESVYIYYNFPCVSFST
jgi:hypothetical protein